MTNKKPYAKSKIGSYELAAWENTIEVRNKSVKRLGYTLSKNYQDANGNWKSQTINFNGITTIRAFVPIVQELAEKASAMITEFNKEHRAETKEDSVAEEKIPESETITF